MNVAVIGTGFVGGILGRALASSGHEVTFGSRHPNDDDVAQGSGARVATVEEAITGADVVILAIPGAQVAGIGETFGHVLSGKLVVDATNQMNAPVNNSRSALPPGTRYARAFNTLGGENMADPNFLDGPADMFFSSADDDRTTVEALVSGVGLRPIYVGADQEELLDAVFRLWIALAMRQGRGRRLAFRLLEP